MTSRDNRSLSQVLDAEDKAVKDGGTACGASWHGDPGQPCMRIKDHETTADHTREAHAALVQGETTRYWLTWVNVGE